MKIQSQERPSPNELKNPKLSVIIPVRNAETTIADQLAALAQQEYEGDWELIIADNGSTDKSLEIVGRWSSEIPAVRIVDASRKAGASHARNVGSSAASGEFLLFCDADDVAAPGWLAAMANEARAADIVGGRLEEEKLNRYPTTSWRLNPTVDGLPGMFGFLPYAVSCNFGIRADVFNEVGGWNERFTGAAGEEVDLCWRAQLMHFTLRYEPNAVMHYRYRESLWELARQRYRYGIASIRLYRDFHSYGIPKERVLKAIRVWKRLILRSPDLAKGDVKRGLWVRDASYYFGMLVGLLRLRMGKP